MSGITGRAGARFAARRARRSPGELAALEARRRQWARAVLGLDLVGLSPAQGRIAATAVGVLLAASLPSSAGYLLWNLGLASLLGVVAHSARRRCGPHEARAATLGVLIGSLLSLAWTAGPTPLAVVLAFCLYRAIDVFQPAPLASIERRGGPLVRDAAAGALAGLALLVLRFGLHSPQAWGVGASTGGAG